MVLEESIVHREFALTGEAVHHCLGGGCTTSKGRPGRRALWCEVADDAVGVSTSRPIKAGNGMEDKTGMTHAGLDGIILDVALVGLTRGRLASESNQTVPLS